MLINNLKRLAQQRQESKRGTYLTLLANAKSNDDADTLAAKLDALGVDYDTFIAGVAVRDEMRQLSDVAGKLDERRVNYEQVAQFAENLGEEQIASREAYIRKYQDAVEARQDAGEHVRASRDAAAALDNLKASHPELAALG